MADLLDDVCVALSSQFIKRVVLQVHAWPAVNKRLYPGDVLAVSRWRNLYEHFAVYVGKNEVIHYASRNGDFGENVAVRKTSLARFIGDSEEYRICRFPKTSRIPGYHLYSCRETVGRAVSRLGEKNYDLFFNNCEHFAIWCKTGLSESRQIEEFLRDIRV